MLHIRVIDGLNFGEEIKTHDSSIRIGRAKECRLTLSTDNTSASRVHVEVYCAGPRTMIRDLNSKHGTLVRKRATHEHIELTPLAPECELEVGDQFVVGLSTLELVDTASDSHRVRLHDDMTMIGLDPVIAISAGDDPESGSDQLLKRFLQLPNYDPTNIDEAKLTLAKSLLDAFPQAASVSVVELRSPVTGRLRRDDLDMNSIITINSKGAGAATAFSFAVLQDTQRRRAVVCYGSPQALPETASVHGADMVSCMCAPLTEGSATIGFVQLFASGREARWFGHRDVHLLGLLSTVAALLIRQAKAAREQTLMRTMASVGQVVAGMSHDARGILSSIGTHAATVEKRHPGLAEDRAWGYVREDLEMLQLLTQDTNIRISSIARPLHFGTVHVRELVDSVLARCRRYYIDDVQLPLYQLENRCDAQAICYADLAPLTMAVMNCIKNALDAYRDAPRQVRPIVVTNHEATEPGGTACVIRVIDDAGGIPPEVAARLGKMLVTTKGARGTGLGVGIIIESISRLNGRVVVASSQDGSADSPAGTVMSLYLPKDSTSTIMKSDSLILSGDYKSLRQPNPTVSSPSSIARN